MPPSLWSDNIPTVPVRARLVTIISGEIYAVTETGETLLRPGDCLVQRGTKHAWSNRGTEPCTLAAVHVAATR